MKKYKSQLISFLTTKKDQEQIDFFTLAIEKPGVLADRKTYVCIYDCFIHIASDWKQLYEEVSTQFGYDNNLVG